MKKKIIIGLVALAVLAVILFGFVLKNGKEKAPKYRTEALAKGDLEATVVTSGTINPVDIIEVGSQVSGKIQKLYADFNSVVKAGQVIAELDQEQARSRVQQNESSYMSSLAALEQAKVNLENAKKKNERTLDLFQRNLVSFEEKETAEANYVGAKVTLQQREASVAQAKASLDSSKVDLSYTVIRSPIDGTVITRNMNIGQTVAASFSAPVLFKIASDLNKMQVQCDIDEADIGKVKEGQSVRFTVDAFQGETFQGSIRQVRNSPTTVQNVVTYQTIVDATNPAGKLRPGMTATVTIITGEAKNVLKVPNSALRFTPTLPQEELQKLMADMRARLQAQRGGQPGQPGQSGPNGQTARTEGGQRGQSGQRFDPSTLTPEQIQRFQQMRQGGARRSGGTVWVLDDAGKLTPYMIRTGVTDNTYSEITRSELKEGMKVIIGVQGATTSSSTSQQQQFRGPGGPGGMMFIGR